MTPAVLVVDDNVAQRAALRAVLEDLDVTVVEAESGRDALRCLLRQPFAVVLLDVNMPGLDGFETATLMRQRPSSEHTPVIFVTAHEDDAYAMRGYSLGAVDYILSPVQPNILRAKVAVFIDLYRNAEEIRAQRQTLERYATQLRQLSEASLAIYSASDFDDVLAVVADNAARIIGARQASVARHAAQRPRHHRRGRGVGKRPADDPHRAQLIGRSAGPRPRPTHAAAPSGHQRRRPRAGGSHRWPPVAGVVGCAPHGP
jgi:response regulator RpfG family c-di-GMP phosphodiesterase